MPEIMIDHSATESKARMSTEHWVLLAALLATLGGLENVQTWADLVNVKTVLKLCASAAFMIRASMVAPK